MSATQPSRRTLVKGAAWSVPVVAVSSAAPAMAQSPCDPSQVTVTSVSRCTSLLFFRTYTVCFTNSCSDSVTVSGVRIDGSYSVGGTVTLGPGESACLTGGAVFDLFPPGTVNVSYSVDGSAAGPAQPYPVGLCGSTSRSVQSTPAEGTQVQLEDGRTLTVRNGQLVDDSGRVITSEKDLQRAAPSGEPKTVTPSPAEGREAPSGAGVEEPPGDLPEPPDQAAQTQDGVDVSPDPAVQTARPSEG